MYRTYFFNKQRQLSQQRETELKRKEDNIELYLRKNPSNNYNKIPDMRKELNQVLNGKHKDVTIDADYDRLCNSAYRYK